MRVAVDDEVVDVVEPEPFEAGVDRFHDVLAGEPSLIQVLAHRPRDLGGDHVLIARGQLAQQRAHDTLAGALPVHIGAIEVVEPLLDRRLEDRSGLVDVQRPVALMASARLAEVHRAEAELGDQETAIATELDGIEHPVVPLRLQPGAAAGRPRASASSSPAFRREGVRDAAATTALIRDVGAARLLAEVSHRHRWLGQRSLVDADRAFDAHVLVRRGLGLRYERRPARGVEQPRLL